MTETWPTSAAKDELFIKGLKMGGYDLFSVPHKGNGGYGGVAILYKKNLCVVKTAVFSIARLPLIQAPSNSMSMWSTDHPHRKRID